MPRPTLKLPRPAPAGFARGPNALAPRKPIRGGSPTSKHARPRLPTALPPVPEEAPAKPAPLHPPRGIARSTGARALPPTPVRPRAEAKPQQPAIAESPAPPTTPSAARPASARLSPSAEQPTRPSRPAEAPVSAGRETPRLAKLVCRLALCSRREADEWIENGWVSVDGKVVARLGARAHPNARIEIHPLASQQRSEAITIVFNQVQRTPAADELDERVLPGEIIRADNHWSEDRALRRFAPTHLRGLALAGKLAPDECGMLVFTQDGNTARQLVGRSSRWEKEYHVRFVGELDDQGLDRLQHGLTVDGIRLTRVQVSRLSEQQLRFVVHDNGRRQIQQMCELLALPLCEIKRVRIGSVPLGKLPPGKWRYLRRDERF